jgi:hypothetical protein
MQDTFSLFISLDVLIAIEGNEYASARALKIFLRHTPPISIR